MTILLIGTSLVLFCFSYFSIYYGAYVLIGKGMRWYRPLFPAVLNTAIILAAYFLRAPLWAFSFFCLPYIVLQLRLLLKVKLLKAFFASSIIMVHASSIYICTVSLMAAFLHRMPYEIYQEPRLLLISIGLAFAAALVVLVLVWKLLPPLGIRTVSTTPVYAGMVSAIALYILLYIVVDYKVMMSEEYFSNGVITSISTVLLTMSLLYILLMYSVKSSQLVAFKRQSDHLERIRMKNKRYQEQLKDAMVKDGLTSCYNRNFIYDILQKNYDSGTADFMVVFMDLNGLKYVNDTFGHDVGDKYIVGVSQAAMNAVRLEDYVARIGGDEFLIVLVDITRADGDRVIERIEESIEELDRRTEMHKVSVSLGSVYVDKTLLTAGIEEIIQLADKDMLEKKERYYCGKGG